MNAYAQPGEHRAAPQQEQPPRLLSPQQVAELLGVSVRSVYRWTVDDELPFFHIGPSPQSPLRADATAIADWIGSKMSAAASDGAHEEAFA